MGINLQTLVTTFAPRVYYHPDEKYYPSSVDWYYSQATYNIRQSNSIMPPPTTLPPGWTWSAVPNGEWDYLSPGSNTALLNGNLESAQAYVHVLDVAGVSNQIDIQYWFFFPNNGDVVLRIEGIFGIVGESPLSLSQHIGDWERIIVRVDISNEAKPEIVAIYFAQHSTGAWMLPAPSGDPSAGYSLTGGTHPIVYCADGTHASYSSAGGPFRIGAKDIQLCEFELVDYTGAGSNVDYWTSSRLTIIANDSSIPYTPQQQPWVGFIGTWGPPSTLPLSPSELAQAVLNILKTTFAASGPLIAIITWLLSPAAVGFLVALGTFLFEMIFGYDQSGPQTPSQQGSWSKSPAFLNWTRDQIATPTGIGQPALVSSGTGIICYYGELMNPPKFSTWSGQKWTEGGAIGKSPSGGGPITALARTSDTVVVFADAQGPINAYCGSGSNWAPLPNWPKLTLSSGFSLVEFSGLFYFFYRCPTGGALSYITTADWQTWSNEQTVPCTSLPPSKSGPSAISPAAVAMNNVLYVAYLQTPIPGTPTPDLIVAPLSITNGTPTWGSQSLIASQASTASPGLTAINGQLVCAYTDTKKVVRYSVSTDGVEWSTATAFPNALSGYGPALATMGSTLICVHNGKSHAQNWYSTVTIG